MSGHPEGSWAYEDIPHDWVEGALYGLERGKSFGYKPESREFWVGDGPDDPRRHTYTPVDGEVEAKLSGVKGVSLLRRALTQ